MLASAREELFRTDLEPHRRAITLHGYRMLGSLEDAEEIAQESLLRGWQRLDELRASGAARAWLYRIATNLCLDALKTRRRRALPPQLAPAGNPLLPFGAPTEGATWVEPLPEWLLEGAAAAHESPDARVSLRESVGLAFIAALQVLPPKQRAALLLVDVLGWRPQETADLLETSLASVNSLLQRARKNVDERDEEPRMPASDEAALLGRYIAAWESGDLESFTRLLADDAVFSMPPQPEWYRGRLAIRQFFERIFAVRPRHYRMIPIRASGAPAIGMYVCQVPETVYRAAAISVLAFRQGEVVRMTRFGDPSLFSRFGLPERLP
jgi:RNA polymerase sigma-70 factor (ECF subfamily)